MGWDVFRGQEVSEGFGAEGGVWEKSGEVGACECQVRVSGSPAGVFVCQEDQVGAAPILPHGQPCCLAVRCVSLSLSGLSSTSLPHGSYINWGMSGIESIFSAVSL